METMTKDQEALEKVVRDWMDSYAADGPEHAVSVKVTEASMAALVQDLQAKWRPSEEVLARLRKEHENALGALSLSVKHGTPPFGWQSYAISVACGIGLVMFHLGINLDAVGEPKPEEQKITKETK